MMRNFILLAFVSIVGIGFLELFSRFYINDPSLNKSAVFSDESMTLYNDYFQVLHHLSDLRVRNPRFNKDPHEAIYTVFRPYSDETTNVLWQGDSWSDQLDRPEIREYLISDARTGSWGMVNAGTSSYSPSLMTVQLRLLRKDFHIRPNVVFAIVDQTDIGDEVCRYRPRLIVDERGQLLSVEPEPFGSRDTYNLRYFFEKQEILRGGGPALLRLVQASILRLRYELEKADKRCGWEKITAPLVNGISENEKEIFLLSLKRYFNEVFADKAVERLFIITHPHRNHFVSPDEGGYRFNVGELVDEAIRRYEMYGQIVHFKVTEKFEDIYGEAPKPGIYKVNDPGSHLTDQSFVEFLLPSLADFSSRNLDSQD